jgi:hypothetical protein
MKAKVGDRIVVHGRHVNDPGRLGKIVDIHGQDGAPPFVVLWEGNDQPVVVVPGPDAQIEPALPGGES